MELITYVSLGYSFHSAGSNEDNSHTLRVETSNSNQERAYDKGTVSSEPKETKYWDNANSKETFLKHCIEKYDTQFLSEWSKTMNFRIWAVEHNPEIR